MSEKLTESDCFVLLANRRRRLAVHVLDESPTPLTTVELAERIADREYDAPSTAQIRSVHLALHHNHLPRLEGCDVVSYNLEDGTVHLGLNFDILVRVLDGANGRDMPWTDE